MSKSIPLKSDPESAVWFIAPFVLLVGPILIFGKNFLRSLATIEAANGRTRYRRFVAWRKLDRDEIRHRGKSSVLIGDMGYLRLSHYLAPWGKLYSCWISSSEPGCR
jgi:hypothetical protein